jgi:hypothetical protein
MLSARRVNKIGDIGSPCLRPLELFKNLEAVPLIMTTKEAVEIS